MAVTHKLTLDEEAIKEAIVFWVLSGSPKQSKNLTTEVYLTYTPIDPHDSSGGHLATVNLTQMQKAESEIPKSVDPY
jgi:hypothetical protein